MNFKAWEADQSTTPTVHLKLVQAGEGTVLIAAYLNGLFVQNIGAFTHGKLELNSLRNELTDVGVRQEWSRTIEVTKV